MRDEGVSRFINKKIISIVIVILVLLGVIGFVLFRIDTGTAETLIAVAESDRTIARVNEKINFSSEKCKGDIFACGWDFGDGNTTTEKDPVHQYESAGWYNVTLTIESEKGTESNSTIAIGIQPNDAEYEYSWDRHRELRPLWASGNGLTVPIGPNIAHPEAEINCNIIQPLGTLDFIVRAEWEIPDTRRWETIYSDSFIGTGQDIQISYLVQPNDLPQEIKNVNASWIQALVIVNEGRWGNLEMSMEIVFPWEDLSPNYT
jgi:PKD repeat protein